MFDSGGIVKRGGVSRDNLGLLCIFDNWNAVESRRSVPLVGSLTARCPSCPAKRKRNAKDNGLRQSELSLCFVLMGILLAIS